LRAIADDAFQFEPRVSKLSAFDPHSNRVINSFLPLKFLSAVGAAGARDWTLDRWRDDRATNRRPESRRALSIG
jgi:hypothetical protein